MTSPHTRSTWWACLLAVSMVLRMSSFAVGQQADTSPVVLSGKYSDLHPEQKRLVDDWFRRLSEVLKQQVSPEDGYNNLPVSRKTTFGAITHALLRTPLTDESGAALGASAMTLVDKIDELLGKVDGAGGDKQFRIYVQLKPGALGILEKSMEFGRVADNTVFHKGYPICFRSRGGTPSIQVSVTRDGKLADIDVDYRSSKVPIALINGHLSASNSDIRAGNNDERHNDRWTGVSTWWRSLLGLPLGNILNAEDDPGLNTQPRTKENAKPAVAVHDFLQTWLVERKPHEVVEYFTDTALACMELERGQPMDRGVARFSMLVGLRQINESIGTITDLSQAVVGVPINKPQLRVIDQPYMSQFVLYDVREDLAEQFNCTKRLNPSLISPKAAKSTAFGKYVGAIFHLKSPQGLKGETVATLWAKENKYWRLVSYAMEPEGDKDSPPTLAAVPPAVAALATDPGDKQLIAASRDFFQKWFIRRRVSEAFRYLSPKAYACSNLYRSDDAPAPASPTEAGQLVQQSMERLAEFAGSVKKLEEAITAPQPSHPDIRLVNHADSAAFAMVAIPDSMAVQADCSKMKPGEELVVATSDAAPKTYGKYYATGLQMTKSVVQPSVLWLVWGRESDQWKIVAYHVITP